MEWRLKLESWASFIASLPRLPWKGEDISGKTILLYTEQGAGDAIQSARFATQLRERGVRPVIATKAHLKTLLRTVPGVEHVVSDGDAIPFSYHAPLFSLPRLLNIEPNTIPANVPYLSPQPESAQVWRRKINNEKLKVGLVWAGNPGHLDDRNRSIDLQKFAALLAFENIQFFSLQVGLQATDLIRINSHNILDLSSELTDYATTAAVISNLDLVITVDTSVAHLAGALAKPVWTLLSYSPDWRWFLDRQDSPWYPTMKLFRQPTPGDWRSVIRSVIDEIEVFRRL